jgi:hypothetical protein
MNALHRAWSCAKVSHARSIPTSSSCRWCLARFFFSSFSVASVVCGECGVCGGECGTGRERKEAPWGAARTEEAVHVDLDDGDLLGVLVELREHVVHVAHPRTLWVLLELQLLLQSHHTNISTPHAQPHTTAHGTHGRARRGDDGTFSLLRLPTCQGR